jgi:hypothetical protein
LASLGNGFVFPPRTAPAAIRQQQNLCVRPLFRGDLFLLYQLREFLPFIFVEPDDIPLLHESLLGSKTFRPLEGKSPRSGNPKNQS